MVSIPFYYTFQDMPNLYMSTTAVKSREHRASKVVLYPESIAVKFNISYRETLFYTYLVVGAPWPCPVVGVLVRVHVPRVLLLLLLWVLVVLVWVWRLLLCLLCQGGRRQHRLRVTRTICRRRVAL